MTKTIEFVEKEKKNSKEFLDRAIRYNLTICLKNETEKLEVLEQIKCELEAWGIVKHSIYKRKMGEERYIQVMGSVYNEGQCYTSGLNPYEILKNTLEVENDL